MRSGVPSQNELRPFIKLRKYLWFICFLDKEGENAKRLKFFCWKSLLKDQTSEWKK